MNSGMVQMIVAGLRRDFLANAPIFQPPLLKKAKTKAATTIDDNRLHIQTLLHSLSEIENTGKKGIKAQIIVTIKEIIECGYLCPIANCNTDRCEPMIKPVSSDNSVAPQQKTHLANKVSLIYVAAKLRDELDRHLSCFFCNTEYQTHHLRTVVLENQIGPLANRMKCIQAMIVQYLMIRFPTVAIHCVNSINKLKVTNIENTVNDYSQHKKDSVSFVMQELEAFMSQEDTCIWATEAHRLFCGVKKKDDLADAYLQGRWFWNKMWGKTHVPVWQNHKSSLIGGMDMDMDIVEAETLEIV